MSKLYQLLGKIPVFRGMEQKELEQLMCFLEEEKFEMGQDILVEYENDEDSKMYVILEGGVEVLKKAPNKDEDEVHLNLLKPGESFGEMGLVDVMVRSATVRSIASTRAFSLSRWNLNRLFDLHPKIYGKLMRNIAQQISKRLRRADVLQASMMHKEQSARGSREFSSKENSEEEASGKSENSKSSEAPSDSKEKE